MKRPWFPLYVADFLADTTNLSYGEVGAYMLLLMHHWKHRELPNDDQALRRIARVPPPHWERVKKAVMPFFSVTPTSITNTRMLAEITKADDLSNKNKANSQRAHAARHRLGTLQSQSTVHSVEKIKKAPPSEEETRARRAAADWPVDYAQQFWNKYPNKVGRKPALEKLDRLAKSGRVTFEAMMAGLDRYVRKTDDRPWCNPATWIFQERWLDQPAAAPAKCNGAHNGQFQKTPNVMDAADLLVAHLSGEIKTGACGSEGGPIIDGTVSSR
jgi:uncharacterized protein YdaU (DUF1376 family)